MNDSTSLIDRVKDQYFSKIFDCENLFRDNRIFVTASITCSNANLTLETFWNMQSFSVALDYIETAEEFRRLVNAVYDVDEETLALATDQFMTGSHITALPGSAYFIRSNPVEIATEISNPKYAFSAKYLTDPYNRTPISVYTKSYKEAK